VLLLNGSFLSTQAHERSHSTHIAGCLLVGAFVQQQSLYLHVAVLGCNVQRGPPILQERDDSEYECTCAPADLSLVPCVCRRVCAASEGQLPAHLI
jgi:hypothetical protein